MRKLFLLALASVALVGCSTVRYSVTNVNPQAKTFDNYEKVVPNVKWSQNYSDFGCSAQDYFDKFPMYDEILDVVITEKHVTTRFLAFTVGEDSYCKYTGVGVKFKQGIVSKADEHVVNEDGTETWTNYNADGSYHVKNSAGWEVWFDADGNRKKMKFSDGSEKTYE